MTLFGYPVEMVRQLINCPTADSAVAAYEMGYMPLVHPSLFDEVHRRIHEMEVSYLLVNSTPVNRATRLMDSDTRVTSGLCALVTLDGSIAVLDCRTQKQKRDNPFGFHRDMTVHESEE